jgi:Ca-activated chloride channel family protein
VPPSPAAPSGPVAISILTTDTKAEWLRDVTKTFYEGRPTIASGRPITVTILQVGGPDEFKAVLMDGSKTQPILLSPGDIGFIQEANQILKDSGKPVQPIDDCPPIAWIPTGFAMWRPMAEAMGWPNKPIGWTEIVELAGDPQGWARYGHPEWGEFTFGHSHPRESTSGFNVMASLAYAASGKTDHLTAADVRSQKVVDNFRAVEKETYHYGLSTSRLLNLMIDGGPGYLHAAATSETSFVYSVEHSGSAMYWPWAFIFPAEGTFWSDNPTCISNGSWVSKEQREAAKIYRDYLLRPAAQERAVQIGLRPVNPSVPLHCPICLEKGTNPAITPKTVPPLPGVDGDTHAAIIDVFERTKKKATIALLLDTSYTMLGVAIKNAVAAVAGKNGFLDVLLTDDEVVAYAFNSTVTRLQPVGRAGDVVEPKLKPTIDSLFADGTTVLYDAVCNAVQDIETLRKEDEAAGEARLYAVVLLSDGWDTASKRSRNEMFACLPSGAEVREVKVYTIAYGTEADKDLLKQIAKHTNGKFFEGNTQNIGKIYLEISAEQ